MAIELRDPATGKIKPVYLIGGGGVVIVGALLLMGGKGGASSNPGVVSGGQSGDLTGQLGLLNDAIIGLTSASHSNVPASNGSGGYSVNPTDPGSGTTTPTNTYAFSPSTPTDPIAVGPTIPDPVVPPLVTPLLGPIAAPRIISRPAPTPAPTPTPTPTPTLTPITAPTPVPINAPRTVASKPIGIIQTILKAVPIAAPKTVASKPGVVGGTYTTQQIAGGVTPTIAHKAGVVPPPPPPKPTVIPLNRSAVR